MKTKILLVATESSPGMIPFAATIINALAECPHFEVYCICVNAGKHSYLQSINQNAHPVFIEYPQNKLKKGSADIIRGKKSCKYAENLIYALEHEKEVLILHHEKAIAPINV